MVALRACQSLPQLKIPSDDNRSILKDTMLSQRLSLSVRNCAGPGLSGLLISSDRLEGAFKERNTRPDSTRVLRKSSWRRRVREEEKARGEIPSLGVNSS